jgi:L-alanine-DL-glutamate epimerase-like enolase superfamily enzyme
MKTNRRKFITNAVAGSLAATLPLSFCISKKSNALVPGLQDPDYARLNEIEKLPVLKKEVISSPVIIDTLELLRFNNSYICRVRSKNGAEGISLAHSGMNTFFPIFINNLQRFFIGKDALGLDSLIDQVYIRNYRMQGQCLGIPTATIEFAILDMLGRIAGKPIGQMIGEIHNPRIEFYLATEGRGTSAEETIKVWQPQVLESKAKEIKIRIGGAHMTNNVDNPPGRTETLIPLVRKVFGDKMFISADSNGSYTVNEAIRVGKILEDYGIIRYEEPVPYDYYEETKQVADALTIPVSGGEQEQSFHQFRQLLASGGLDIAEPDCYYFGGMIRSTKIARIAEACGKKQCTPHMSSGRLGFLYMLHFVSALPNAGFRPEFKGFDIDIPYECKTGALKSEDGVITVPTGPGLGVDIDPDYIKKHEVVNRM